MATVKDIQKAIDVFFEWAHDKDFCKSVPLSKVGERTLLPYLKTFFLGRFGEVDPEYSVSTGRIDFVVKGIAIEVVVRKPSKPKTVLAPNQNTTEIKKLLKYNEGKAVLAMMDFSKTPITETELNEFRDWPSPGQGRHKVSAFNVTYHYRKNKKFGSFRKIIRVN
jgi:hypothetical protein